MLIIYNGRLPVQQPYLYKFEMTARSTMGAMNLVCGWQSANLVERASVIDISASIHQKIQVDKQVKTNYPAKKD